MKDFIKLVAQFSLEKLADPAYWADWALFWLGALVVFVIVVGPFVLKGGISPLAAFSSQLAQGWFWFRKGIYPDIIGNAMHILRRGPDETLEFDLDYQSPQQLLKNVVPNSFQAFQLRNSVNHSCPTSHIMRLNPHPSQRKKKKRKWWNPLRWEQALRESFHRRFRKPGNPLKNYSKKKAKVIQRYQRLYKPLMASLATFTNETAGLAMLNVPMERRLVLVCKTFAHRPGHEAYHRLHLFDADTLGNWPEHLSEPVSIVKPEYVDRFHLSALLARQYRRYPWRFGVLVYFLRPENAKLIKPSLPEIPGPFKGWKPFHQRQMEKVMIVA